MRDHSSERGVFSCGTVCVLIKVEISFLLITVYVERVLTLSQNNFFRMR